MILNRIILLLFLIQVSGCVFKKKNEVEFIKDDQPEAAAVEKTPSATIEPDAKSSQPEAEKGQPLVVIDAGHGGKDQGAHGVNELLEKDYVLTIAHLLKKELLKQGIKVALTRDEDEFVSLKKRTKIANGKNAKLFISLHGNASPGKNKSGQGLHIYYLDNTNDAASRKLAERENLAFKDEQREDDTVSFIISDIIQTTKINHSIILSEVMLKSIRSALKKQFKSAKVEPPQKAPFYVLTGTHVPSVLVELFFIDSKKDAEIIHHPAYPRLISSALADGIVKYLAKYDK